MADRQDRRQGRGERKDLARGPRRPQRSRQAPAQRARRTDPSRRVSYQVMRLVADGAHANLELPKRLRGAQVEGRDAAFATELTYGALRMRGLYDEIIALAAGRPVAQIDEPILDILRLGAHQILAMRVPSHAAVSETVALAREENGPGPSGFVNAVLRRLSERSRDEWIEFVGQDEDALGRLALHHSHPRWVATALREALIGHGTADASDADIILRELLIADNAPPEVHLVARPGLCEPQDLDGDTAPGMYSPYAVHLQSGDPSAFAQVRDGRAAVQDEGSQVVALALAAAPLEGEPAGEKSRWLDLCAGPGGKAGLLGAVAHQQGASLQAVEVSEHRAELVSKTFRALRRAGADIDVVCADGREVGADQPGAFDRVLVDAPCTGLGALRRRPEARWRRQSSDLQGLGPLQRDLLASALDAVRPGGVVGYSTCSPHLAETVFVVQDVLSRRDDVELIPAGPVLSEVTDGRLVADGWHGTAQLWPQQHGTDGMFLALLRRKR